MVAVDPAGATGMVAGKEGENGTFTQHSKTMFYELRTSLIYRTLVSFTQMVQAEKANGKWTFTKKLLQWDLKGSLRAPFQEDMNRN